MSKILIKDIKEISKHNPHSEIKNKIKEYLDNNPDWIKNLELFNLFPKIASSQVTPIEISFIVDHDEFNDLIFPEKCRIIFEIIGIENAEFNYRRIYVDSLNDKRLNLYLCNQTDVYLFCKSLGYIDKLLQVIADNINNKILTHKPNKNYISTTFDLQYAYRDDFEKCLRGIFPDCYTLKFFSNMGSLDLDISWRK